MDHEHFIRIVKEKSSIADDQDAHRATCQTLHTLAPEEWVGTRSEG